MPGNLWAIITNTFTEALRQPIYGVVVGATILMLFASPSLVMFTLDDDNQLLKDIGLSTLLVAGLFLAVFTSASVVSDEIENKTVLTVVSKTVSRWLFVVGKFIGIAGAVVLAEYLLGLVLLMVVRHGVMQTARDESDMVVITLGAVGAGLTVLIGLLGNYFYQWRFTSTAVTLATIFATIIMGVLLMVDPHWRFNPAENNINVPLIGPMVLTVLAVLILTAVALAAATRVNMVTTLIICALVFLLGTMLPHWLGPVVARGGIWSYLAWAGLAVAPHINAFVVTNAVYENQTIPLDYIGKTALYAFLYVGAVLMFAIGLFRHREIG